MIVQGLPFAYAWQDLKDLFKPIGGLLQADIVMGQDGRSRGWGTVNFETQADAEKAIKVTCKPLTHLQQAHLDRGYKTASTDDKTRRLAH